MECLVYGFMNEYAVGRTFCDSRIQTAFGGPAQSMKVVVVGRGPGR